MIRLAAFLLITSACFSQVEVVIQPYITGLGAGRVYRGYSAHLRLHPVWVNGYAVDSVDVGTDLVTATTPHSTTSSLRFVSRSNNLPQGFHPFFIYNRCSTNNPFYVKTQWGSCGETTRQSPLTTGGTDLRVGVRRSNSSVFTAHAITLPQGVTLLRNPRYDHGAALAWNAAKQAWLITGNSASHMNIDLAVASNAPLGAANIVITSIKHLDGDGYTDGEIIRVHTIAITIQDIVPVSLSYPSSFQEIAASTRTALRTKWRQQANGSDTSRKICDEATGQIVYSNPAIASPNALSLSSSGENGVWYYQGQAWFWEGARIVEKPEFRACAQTIAQWYVGRILANAGIESYQRFTTGLAIMGPELPQWRRAVFLNLNQFLSNYSNPVKAQGASLRDNAYAVINTIQAFRACNAASLWVARRMTNECGVSNWVALLASLEDAVSVLGQSLDEMTIPNVAHGQQFQTWMSGLATLALMDYYEWSQDERSGTGNGLTRDPRPMRWIKDFTDHFIANWYLPPSGSLRARTLYPITSNRLICEYNCTSSSTNYESNLLTAISIGPAAAFLYYYTGDSTYQTVAHDVLASMASLNFGNQDSGKIRGQNYTTVALNMLGYMLGHGRVVRHGYVLQ